MRLVLIASMVVGGLVLGACGGGDDASGPTTTTSPTTIAPTTAPTTTVPAPPAPGATVAAQYTCGPADGPAVDVTVFTDAAAVVRAEVRLGADELGRSDPLRTASGTTTTTLVDLDLPAGAYGGSATVVLLQDGSDVELATADFALRLPEGVFCG